MSEEDKKIVIVIGAGASFDFHISEDKKFNENHGNIKYEIWENPSTNTNNNSNKNAQYFLSEKNLTNYSFPSGEVLIKMIGNTNKIAKIFLKKIINDKNFSDFIENLVLENEDKEKILYKKYPVIEQMWEAEETSNFGSLNFGLQNLVNGLNPTKIPTESPKKSPEQLRKILKIEEDSDKNSEVTFFRFN